jgi:hypothetical protein
MSLLFNLWSVEFSQLILAHTHTHTHIYIYIYIYKQTNSVAFIPQANYTDWATATCWRNLVPTFADRRVSRGQRGSPTVLKLSFLDWIRSISFQWLLIYLHKGWVDHVPDPLVLRKSASSGNRTRNFSVCNQEVWTLDHRGGIYIYNKPVLYGMK